MKGTIANQTKIQSCNPKKNVMNHLSGNKCHLNSVIISDLGNRTSFSENGSSGNSRHIMVEEFGNLSLNEENSECLFPENMSGKTKSNDSFNNCKGNAVDINLKSEHNMLIHVAGDLFGDSKSVGAYDPFTVNSSPLADLEPLVQLNCDKYKDNSHVRISKESEDKSSNIPVVTVCSNKLGSNLAVYISEISEEKSSNVLPAVTDCSNKLDTDSSLERESLLRKMEQKTCPVPKSHCLCSVSDHDDDQLLKVKKKNPCEKFLPESLGNENSVNLQNDLIEEFTRLGLNDAKTCSLPSHGTFDKAKLNYELEVNSILTVDTNVTPERNVEVNVTNNVLKDSKSDETSDLVNVNSSVPKPTREVNHEKSEEDLITHFSEINFNEKQSCIVLSSDNKLGNVELVRKNLTSENLACGEVCIVNLGDQAKDSLWSEQQAHNSVSSEDSVSVNRAADDLKLLRLTGSPLLHSGDDYDNSEEELTERSPSKAKKNLDDQKEPKIICGRVNKTQPGDFTKLHMSGGLVVQNLSNIMPTRPICNGLSIGDLLSQSNNPTGSSYHMPIPKYLNQDIMYNVRKDAQSFHGENAFTKLYSSPLSESGAQPFLSMPTGGCSVSGTTCIVEAQNQQSVYDQQSVMFPDSLLDIDNNLCLSPEILSYGQNINLESVSGTICTSLPTENMIIEERQNDLSTSVPDSLLDDFFDCSSPCSSVLKQHQQNSRATSPESGYGSPILSPYSDDDGIDQQKLKDQSPVSTSCLDDVCLLSPSAEHVNNTDKSTDQFVWDFSIFDKPYENQVTEEDEISMIKQNIEKWVEDFKSNDTQRNDKSTNEHSPHVQQCSDVQASHLQGSVSSMDVPNHQQKSSTFSITPSEQEFLSKNIHHQQELSAPTNAQLNSTQASPSPQVIVVYVPYVPKNSESKEKRFRQILPKPSHNNPATESKNPKKFLLETLDNKKVGLLKYEIYKMLESNNDKVIHVQNKETGQTNLHIAVINKELELAYCILEIHKQFKKNLSAVNLRDIYNKTALQYADPNTTPEFIEYLKAFGAK